MNHYYGNTTPDILSLNMIVVSFLKEAIYHIRKISISRFIFFPFKYVILLKYFTYHKISNFKYRIQLFLVTFPPSSLLASLFMNGHGDTKFYHMSFLCLLRHLNFLNTSLFF